MLLRIVPLFLVLSFTACEAPSTSGSAGHESTPDSGAGAAAGAGGASNVGGGGPVDITDAVFTGRSGDCGHYASDSGYVAFVTDVQQSSDFDAAVNIVATASSCNLTSNAIPNHDFDDATASFANLTTEVEQSFTLPRNPAFAASATPIGLMSFNAVMLNGIVVDLLSAGCYGVGNGKVGCTDLSTPWRYDPMSPTAGFGTDAHHAHTQGDGRYHYHGDPLAMYGSPEVASPVIGFAADGFPVYGPYFDDGGDVREATSGYTLRSGARPTEPGSPGGSYDGTFIDDYEYAAAGDLDECNGMTIDGQYGYYVTRTYPWVLNCLRGTPDPSFNKNP